MKFLCAIPLLTFLLLPPTEVAGDDDYERRTTAGMMNGYGLAEYADHAAITPRQIKCHEEKHEREDTVEERLTLDTCRPKGDTAKTELVEFFIAGVAEGLGLGAYDAMTAVLVEMTIPELYEEGSRFPGIKRVPVRALVEREIQCARGVEVEGADPCTDEYLLSLVRRWRDVK